MAVDGWKVDRVRRRVVAQEKDVREGKDGEWELDALVHVWPDHGWTRGRLEGEIQVQTRIKVFIGFSCLRSSFGF